MDPYILADPNPRSQNHADLTDPDPKHWFSPRQHMLNLKLERYVLTYTTHTKPKIKYYVLTYVLHNTCFKGMF